MKRRTGRPITLTPGQPRTARAIIREHLRFAKLDIHNDLSAILGVSKQYAGCLMRRHRYAIVPERIEQVITALQLDEFDANELRLVAAREAGWEIDARYIGVTQNA